MRNREDEVCDIAILCRNLQIHCPFLDLCLRHDRKKYPECKRKKERQ
jgi:hypothetical protein